MSGHTTFSARTNKFYQHMIQNEKRIMLRKELGLDPLKRDRDPILHPDVTPRNHPPTILDSKASTLPQLKERWKYPETDEGLVSVILLTVSNVLGFSLMTGKFCLRCLNCQVKKKNLNN